MSIENRLKSMTKKGLVALALRLGMDRPSKFGKDDLVAHMLEKIPKATLIENLTPHEKKKRKLSIGLIGAYASIIGLIFTILFFYISKEGGKTGDKKNGNIEKKLESFDSLKREQIIKKKDMGIFDKSHSMTKRSALEDDKTVYVWDFTTRDSKKNHLTSKFTHDFESALVQSKCYKILERRNYDRTFAHIDNEKAIAEIANIS